MLLFVTNSGSDWDESVTSMTKMGHPQHMGSDLRGGVAEFCYFDTANETGFVVESVVAPKSDFIAPDRLPVDPRVFAIDFTQLITVD